MERGFTSTAMSDLTRQQGILFSDGLRPMHILMCILLCRKALWCLVGERKAPNIVPSMSGGLRERQPGWDIEGRAADRLVWEPLIYVIKVIFSDSHINNDQVITLAQSIKWQQLSLVVNTVPLQIIVIRSVLHQSVALIVWWPTPSSSAISFIFKPFNK